MYFPFFYRFTDSNYLYLDDIIRGSWFCVDSWCHLYIKAMVDDDRVQFIMFQKVCFDIMKNYLITFI